MGKTKETTIQELSVVGKVALYTGGLKIVMKEQERMGKIQTTYDAKLRRLHPIILFIAIFGLITQGINKEVIGEIKDLYTVDSVWF